MIPVDEFTGLIRDIDYIEGAIDLTVGGVQLLSTSMWDLVDQLWAYLINSLEDLASQDTAETCFPDQPITVRFSKEIEGKHVRIDVRAHSSMSARIETTTLVDALTREARKFFEALRRVAATYPATGELKRIAAVRATFNL